MTDRKGREGGEEMEWGVFTGEGESNHRSTWMKSE